MGAAARRALQGDPARPAGVRTIAGAGGLRLERHRARGRPRTLPRCTRDRTLPSRRRQVRRLGLQDRKSTRLNSSHVEISYAVFCLKKKKKNNKNTNKKKKKNKQNMYNK